MNKLRDRSLSRRSFVMHLLMALPLWQASRMAGIVQPSGEPDVRTVPDEFVEIDGWILRRSDIA